MACENAIGLINFTVNGVSYRFESEGVMIQPFDFFDEDDGNGRYKQVITKPTMNVVILKPKGLNLKDFGSLCDGVVVFEEHDGQTWTGTNAMFLKESGFEYDLSNKKFPAKFVCDKIDELSNV